MSEATVRHSVPAQAIEQLLARSAIYQGLSRALRHPDAGTAQWLVTRAHRRLPELAQRVTGPSDGRLLDAVRRLVVCLDRLTIADWAREHERVFGHAVQGSSPPYELEYGEEHSHRQPQELGDIAAFYQAFGLRASTASHERVDHIVTECEFMQYLLYKQACAFDEGSQERAEVCEAAARQFLADHLGCWGPAFCLRLSRAAREGILGAAADAALAWLAQDCQHLGIAAGSRDLPLRLPKERDDVGCASCMPATPHEDLNCAAQAGALQQPGSADGQC